MPSLNMYGPYELNNDEISRIITRTSPGNYALGFIDKEGKFRFKYIGRADSDIAGRLKRHLNEGYTFFKYSYASSPKAAFEKECQNYHDFDENKKLANKIHPDRPNNTNWKCPVCNIFG